MSDLPTSRRRFLKGAAVTAAAAGVASTPLREVFAASSSALSAGPGNKWPGRVVVNFNKDAITMNGALASANPEIISKMVDDSIKLLTGESTVGAAWKVAFPSTLTAQSKVAIKVPLGFSATNMAPHWASVKAVTDGLQQMDFNGTKFPGENISIFDMHGSNQFGKADFGYTANNFGKVKLVSDSVGSGYSDGPNKLQYAKSLGTADFLINVFRAGGHGDWGEGLTLGFKNHYGTFPSPSSFHNKPVENLRDINCTGVVFNKNVLSVCSGIFGAKEKSGMPTSAAISYAKYAKTIDSTLTSDSYPACTIIMSTDPVTAEMQTVKMMRLNNGGKYGVNDMPKYLRASAGVNGAATPTYNIGIIDESKMDIRKIINGQVISTAIDSRSQLSERFQNGCSLHARQLKGTRSTFVEYNVLSDTVGKKASVDIYSVDGSLVFKKNVDVKGINNNFSWDEKDSSGKHVSNGIYVIKVAAGSTQLSSRISITR